MSRKYTRPTTAGMKNLNGDILCAIDVETTGFVPGYNDIWQIAILPLGPDIQSNKKLMPFYMDIALKRPETVNPKAVKLTRIDFARRMQRAQDAFIVADQLDEWFERLHLPAYKKICPLAQNWPFDREFVKEWLGDETFFQLFSPRYRDTMSTALFMNDCAEFSGDIFPYPKVNLPYLGSQLKVANAKAHDALQDCLQTAEIYRRMVMANI